MTHPEVALVVSRLYFMEVRRVGMALDAANAHLLAVRTRMMPNGIDYAAVHYGEAPDMADLAAEAEEAEKERGERLGHWINVQEEAGEVARHAGDPMAEQVLRLYYIDGYSTTFVCRSLHIGAATMARLKRQGLISCYRAVPEEWKRSLPNADG